MQAYTCVRHCLVAILAVSSVLADDAAALEAGFTSMFNGRDLAGWEGRPGWWSVEHGAIMSQSTPRSRATALIT
jgi:hypothetical protein